MNNDLVAHLEQGGAVATIDSAPLQLLEQQVKMTEICGQLGGYYAQTNLVPKQYAGKPGDCAVAIQWGAEIGLSPLQALQNIAVVNNNPTLWGDALVALVRGSGQCEYLTTNWDATTMTATVKTKRKGDPAEEVRTYSLEEAKAAGLAGRDTYKKFPQRMLSARARSHLLRDVYADILKGLKVREVEEENEAAGVFKEPKDITPKDITPKTQSETLQNLLTPEEKEAVTEQVDTETGEIEAPANDERSQMIQTYVETHASEFMDHKANGDEKACNGILQKVEKKLSNEPQWLQSFYNLVGIDNENGN